MSDDDEVGYGNPPKSTQFKKGQSGNPKGRPKGSKNLRTLVLDELCELVQVRENDKVTKISKMEAVLKSTMAKAIKGDLGAIRAILDLAERHYPEEDLGTKDRELSQDEEEIFEQYIGRFLQLNKEGSDGENQ